MAGTAAGISFIESITHEGKEAVFAKREMGEVTRCSPEDAEGNPVRRRCRTRTAGCSPRCAESRGPRKASRLTRRAFPGPWGCRGRSAARIRDRVENASLVEEGEVLRPARGAAVRGPRERCRRSARPRPGRPAPPTSSFLSPVRRSKPVHDHAEVVVHLHERLQQRAVLGLLLREKRADSRSLRLQAIPEAQVVALRGEEVAPLVEGVAQAYRRFAGAFPG